MGEAVFAASVALAQDAGSSGDDLGIWVLLIALGVGTAVVLLMVVLLDWLSAVVRARERRRAAGRAGALAASASEQVFVTAASVAVLGGPKRRSAVSPLEPPPALLLPPVPPATRPPSAPTPPPAPALPPSVPPPSAPPPASHPPAAPAATAVEAPVELAVTESVDDAPTVVPDDGRPRIARVLPSITMPRRLQMPHLPRVHLPRVHAPHVSVPHVSVPHVRLPRVPVPAVHLPQVALPAGVGTAFRRRAGAVATHVRTSTAAADRPTRPARIAAAALVPALLLLRTALDPSWLSGGYAWLAIAFSLVVAGVGAWWLSVASHRPRALRRRTRERLLLADQQRGQRVDAAGTLLAGLAAGKEPSRLWSDFTATSGLHAPPQLQRLISPAMEPAALVEYLSVRSGQVAVEAPAWLVVGVPLLCCTVPAAVLVLAV